MLKTLAARAIVPVTCAVAGFVAVCCILLYTNMKQDRIEERVFHANDISGVLVKSTRYAMLKDDREMLEQIVNNVNQEVLVEHVRIFNKQGRVVFSGDRSEVGHMVDETAEGCYLCHFGDKPIESLGPMEQARRFTNDAGVPVLAITEPIYNGPECSNASCHYHQPTQVVLGTLDVGLSEAPLQRTLALTRRQLGLFAVLVLVLCVGGVAALLWRNVVAPLRVLTSRAQRTLSTLQPTGSAEMEDELRVLARAVALLEQQVPKKPDKEPGNGARKAC